MSFLVSRCSSLARRDDSSRPGRRYLVVVFVNSCKWRRYTFDLSVTGVCDVLKKGRLSHFARPSVSGCASKHLMGECNGFTSGLRSRSSISASSPGRQAELCNWPDSGRRTLPPAMLTAQSGLPPDVTPSSLRTNSASFLSSQPNFSDFCAIYRRRLRGCQRKEGSAGASGRKPILVDD